MGLGLSRAGQEDRSSRRGRKLKSLACVLNKAFQVHCQVDPLNKQCGPGGDSDSGKPRVSAGVAAPAGLSLTRHGVPPGRSGWHCIVALPGLRGSARQCTVHGEPCQPPGRQFDQSEPVSQTLIFFISFDALSFQLMIS